MNDEIKFDPKEQIYSKNLAEIYDAIVYGKDEAYAETDELNFIINNIPEISKKLLDLGCGCGKFLIPLASMGYEMTGIDISAGVLNECESRLKSRNLNADLIKESADKIDFNAEFDAVICMDSVLHYFNETDKIIDVLKKIRSSLKPGGKLIIENRNLIADIDYYSEPRVETVETEKLKVTYTCKNKFDKNSLDFYIDINAEVERDGKISSFVHSEVLRYIPYEDMMFFLQQAGFNKIKFMPDFKEEKNDDFEIISFVFIAEKE